MTYTSPEFVLGVLGVLGIGGVVTVLLTLGPTRRKLKVEAEKQKADVVAVYTSTAIDLMEPMKLELNELRAEVKSLNTQLKEVNSELDHARDEIRDLRADAASMSRELETYRQAAEDRHNGTG